jgi:hypothetical protein
LVAVRGVSSFHLSELRSRRKLCSSRDERRTVRDLAQGFAGIIYRASGGRRFIPTSLQQSVVSFRVQEGYRAIKAGGATEEAPHDAELPDLLWFDAVPVTHSADPGTIKRTARDVPSLPSTPCALRDDQFLNVCSTRSIANDARYITGVPILRQVRQGCSGDAAFIEHCRTLEVSLPKNGFLSDGPLMHVRRYSEPGWNGLRNQQRSDQVHQTHRTFVVRRYPVALVHVKHHPRVISVRSSPLLN